MVIVIVDFPGGNTIKVPPNSNIDIINENINAIDKNFFISCKVEWIRYVMLLDESNEKRYILLLSICIIPIYRIRKLIGNVLFTKTWIVGSDEYELNIGR